MKKVFFFAVAAVMAITACSKNEIVAPTQNNQITFQAANYAIQTKVNGSEFPQDDVFGVYAWTAGTTGEYFIENNQVSFINGVWTTATPYYWPKNQTVDFFCYYPYNVAGTIPTVTKTKITYTDINFTDKQVDLMYADKAVGYTDNANQVEDGVNALEGVPTYFHHAGARVAVNVVLGDNEKTNPATGTSTRWDVKLKRVVLSGIYIKGTCEMTLADSPATGIVSWVKPEDAEGYKVWTPDVTVTNAEDSNPLYNDVQERVLEKGVGQAIFPFRYMLPQTLAAGQQKIGLVVDITTYKKESTDADYPTTPFLTQENVAVSADLLIPSTGSVTGIYAWEMNQSIVYNITLGPAGNQITFDPAIEGWSNVTVGTNIELEVD